MCDTYMGPRARMQDVFYTLRNIFASFFILKMEKLLFFRNLEMAFTKLYKYKLWRRLPVALCTK